MPTNGSNGSLDLSAVTSVLELLKTTNVKSVWIRSTIDNPKLFDLFSDYPFNIFHPEFLARESVGMIFDPPLIVLGKSKQDSTIVEDSLRNHLT